MSAKTRVTMRMSALVLPKRSRIASIFATRACVCASTPSGSAPVAGSCPVWALRKSRSPKRVASAWYSESGDAILASESEICRDTDANTWKRGLQTLICNLYDGGAFHRHEKESQRLHQRA